MPHVRLAALVGASLILSCGSGAIARQPRPAPHAITVRAEPVSIDQWSTRIGRDLDDHLDYPRPMGTDDYPEGVAKVAFRCTDDGVPGEVTLARSSGSRLVDHAAIQAVNRLSTLHPLPEGVQSGQRVVAWIVLARDEESRGRMLGSLRREAQMANVATARQIADRGNPADRPAIVIASR